jgi:LysR family glycine cleavage system transcriptional activator
MFYRLPPLHTLRAFEVAARHLSFKRAAEELCVTPTAVSHQIKGLEEFLGVLLFRRLTRALELTAQGGAILAKVREGLECFAGAVESSHEHRADGRLFVIAPPSFATQWLVPRLRRLTVAAPELRLHLLSSIDAIDDEGSIGAVEFENIDLREENSQVAIRFGTGSYQGCRVDRIFGSDYIAVCSPSLVESGLPLRKPDDVGSRVLLHDDTISNERARPNWEEWLRMAGVTTVDCSAGPHFSDSGLALTAAVHGIGIALASKTLVAAAIAEGRLISPFDVAVGQHYAYFLVTPEAICDRPPVEAFRQWLLAEVRTDESFRANDDELREGQDLPPSLRPRRPNAISSCAQFDIGGTLR